MQKDTEVCISDHSSSCIVGLKSHISVALSYKTVPSNYWIGCCMYLQICCGYDTEQNFVIPLLETEPYSVHLWSLNYFGFSCMALVHYLILYITRHRTYRLKVLWPTNLSAKCVTYLQKTWTYIWWFQLGTLHRLLPTFKWIHGTKWKEYSVKKIDGEG
jgi:hypothetical protein